MKVMIVEDEEGIRRLLCKIIGKKEEFEVVAACGSFGDALIEYSKEKPDIVFMDIEIKEHEGDICASDKVNGMECARILSNLNPRIIIIFVTAHSEYMSNAFDIYAYDYIVKPFDVERVERTLNRIWERSQNKESYAEISNIIPDSLSKAASEKPQGRKLMIRGKESVYFIDVDDIVMIERNNGITIINTVSGEYNTSMGLREIMEKLVDGRFLRSHKSYIINMDYISKIESYGRWTYLVKFKGKSFDALITSAMYEKIKEIYG